MSPLPMDGQEAATFEDHDTAPTPKGEKAAEPAYGDQPAAGELLTLPENEAAALAVKLFVDQGKRPDVRRRHAQWEVNRLRRLGYCNVEVVKHESQNKWTARMLPGLSRIVPGWNKADDLCEKMLNQQFVDEPAPDPIPATAADEDVEAAELAERALKDVQAEGHLDDLQAHREAFDLSSTYSRAFIRYYVDPQGARGPVQILAHPQAVSADAPFTIPAQPTVDPMTGMEIPGQPVEAPPPYVLRYVSKDGQLTDNRAEAAERWLPRLCREVLDPRHVRFLPATARDIWAAEGVAIGAFRSVTELRALFPEAIKALGTEGLEKLVAYRPDTETKDLWPEGSPKESDTTPLDDRLIFTVTVYYKQCAAYPTGAYVVAAGKDTLLTRDQWLAEMSDGTTEALDLPLTEYVQFWRGRREPVALMELLGPVTEQRSMVLGYWQQAMDDASNAATFVSVYGGLRAEDLENRNSKYLPYVPGHPPIREDVADFSPTAMAFFEATNREADTLSGLDQTSRLEDPNVGSGAHAREIRSQALVAVSGLNQNIARAYTRACRLQLQLIRWQFTVPQQIGWTGEDGQYRQQYWTGMDLRGTRDVRLKKGTLSMMSSQAKAQEAVYYAGLSQKGVPPIIAPDELREILNERVGSDVGLRDNPHRQRIKRQIAAWVDGPPEGWTPPAPTMGMDPMTGAPVQQPGVDPMLAGIWAPVPADNVQDVALIRYQELARCMAGTKYARKPAEWRAGLDMEFEKMRQAAGVATVAEQQAAAAQQAQQAEAQRQQQRGEANADAAAADQRKADQQQQTVEGKAMLNQINTATAAVA